MSQVETATILVGEDNLVQREAVASLLIEAGFTVWKAGTAAEVLHLADKRPDLVLLDVGLPDLSGFEVCRLIKANSDDLPLLLVSGDYVKTEHRVHGLEDGADCYLTKPVDPQELIAQIKVLLRIYRAERALKHGQESYRSLAEHVPDIVARFDSSLRHVFVNHRVQEVTGIPADQFIGKTNAELGMPDYLVHL